MNELKHILDQSLELVRLTSNFVLQERKSLDTSDLETKGYNNFVTRVDKASEEKLVAGLSKILPLAGFIAEEGTSSKIGDEYNWIVDPIDGTTNYIHDVPCYAISLALQYKDDIVLGIVHEITRNESFYSIENGPALLNGNEIQTTSATSLTDALIATGFPYDDFEDMDKYLRFLRLLMEKSRGMRRLGSAAVDLAYVACGRFDVFYEYGLSPWDVAAGAFIVQQAGGNATDFSGGNNFIFGKEILTSNGDLHQELLDFMKANYK